MLQRNCARWTGLESWSLKTLPCERPTPQARCSQQLRRPRPGRGPAARHAQSYLYSTLYTAWRKGLRLCFFIIVSMARPLSSLTSSPVKVGGATYRVKGSAIGGLWRRLARAPEAVAGRPMARPL